MNFSHEKHPGKNFTGIAVVILVHALVAWGIVSGLGTRMVTKIADAVETKIIEEVKPPPPKEVPPPPPPPEMAAPPPPFIPPVEVNVQQVAPPPPIAVSTPAKPATTELTRPAPPVAGPPSTGPATGVKTAAVVDFNSCAKPEYPSASVRNEESGTVTISFLVGVDGQMKESKITKTSGFKDLDRAAQKAIGKCPFKAALLDGKPVESWHPVQYIWNLD